MAYLRNYQMAAMGDPGLFSFVKKAAKGALNLGGKILSSPVGMVATTLLPGGLALKGAGLLTKGLSAAKGAKAAMGFAGMAGGVKMLPKLPGAGAMVKRGVGFGGALKGGMGRKIAAGLGVAGAGAAIGSALDGGTRRRYRRINYTNMRALRRSCRRIKGFEKLAKEVLVTSKKVRCAPRRKSRCR